MIARLIIGVAALLLLRALWLCFLCPLSRLPGPLLARVTSLWRYSVIRRSQMPWVDAHWHRECGHLVRTGPTHVSADSLEALKKIYLDGKGFPKSDMYNLLQPYWEGSPLHNIFSTQDIQYHTKIKRMLGHIYSMSSIIRMESKADAILKQFISRLEGLSSSGSAAIDMSAWLQYYTFDTQAQLNFSEPIGFIEHGADVGGFCHMDHEMMVYFAEWGQIQQIEKMVSWCRSFFAEATENPLYTFVLERIRHRLECPTEDSDFLNAALKVHKEFPDIVDKREVTAAVYINIVTGHDVTAIQLRALVYNTVRSSNTYKCLQNEIDSLVQARKVSSPAKYSEIAELPYFSAVIQETLRIHPSAGLILERIVPSGGVVIHDTFLPAGTTVGINAWAINRDREIFGEDADIFRPERWLEASGTQLHTMKKAMFTFGGGARSCIGKSMALLQLYKVTFELFRNFTIESLSEHGEWHVVGGWLTRQTNMRMRVVPRKIT